jgi:hypothetical protein
MVWLAIGLMIPGQQKEPSIEIYAGPELNMANNIQVPEIIGHDETGFYCYSFDYREAIEFLDTRFRTVRRKYIDLSYGSKMKTLEGLFHFHDSIYLFTSYEKYSSVQLFVETIDKKTLTQNRDERLLMEVRNMAGWTAEFGFKLSRLHDYLLVFSRQDVMTKKIQDLHFELYGKGMTLLWETDQRIIYRGRRPRESILEVSDRGDVFLMNLLDDQGIRSLWQEIKNRYTLVAITDNGANTRAYTLNLPELYIRGVQIEPGGRYDLSCAGFYSPTHNRSMIDGIFYFDLDNKTGVYRNQKLHEFEPWFISEAIPGKMKNEPEELFDFKARQLIQRTNGDMIFIAEIEFDQQYETYRNIMLASIEPGGALHWKRIIPKNQGIDRHSPINYSSYSVHAQWNRDPVHLVFNDHIKNGEWPRSKKLKSFHPHERSNLKVVSVGPRGEISSQIVQQKNKRKMKTPIPLQYYDMLDNRMVIPAHRLKRYNYLKLSFNE